MATKKKTTSGIVMLPVNELVPHPDNPRRELGDLTELAESIRKNGIRQNLTVVDYGNSGYRIIIGHRRHAAAKLAGVTEVPCIIAEMSEREQLETMLTENLMREDLKLSEQVRTFEQLRLEGATADEIAGTTGFSETYVRTRLKYASMIGADELKSIEIRAADNERQITLDELDKLCSIKSPADRRKLSEAVGTNNFDWDYRAAKSQEKAREGAEAARKALGELGITEIEHEVANGKYGTNNRFLFETKEFVSNPEKTLTGRLPKGIKEPLFYSFISEFASWFYVCVGEPGSQAAKNDLDRAEEKKKAEQEKEQGLRNELKEAFRQAYELRRNFMDDLTAGDMKKTGDIAAFFMFLIMHGDEPDYDDLADMLDLPPQGDASEEKFCDMVENAMTRVKDEKAAMSKMLKAAYVAFNDNAYCPFQYDRKYHESSIKWQLKLYGYLVRLGYKMSDEENALMYGHHRLYKEADE